MWIGQGFDSDGDGDNDFHIYRRVDVNPDDVRSAMGILIPLAAIGLCGLVIGWVVQAVGIAWTDGTFAWLSSWFVTIGFWAYISLAIAMVFVIFICVFLNARHGDK